MLLTKEALIPLYTKAGFLSPHQSDVQTWSVCLRLADLPNVQVISNMKLHRFKKHTDVILIPSPAKVGRFFLEFGMS